MTDCPVCRLQIQTPKTGRDREPVTTGVALPRGWCRDASALRLLDEQFRPQPLQTRALEQWSDGSVRWALLDFQLSSDSESTLTLSVDTDLPAPRPQSPLSVQSLTSGATVDTGQCHFTFSTGSATPIAAVSVGGGPVLDASRTRCVVIGKDGHPLPVRFDRVEVEEHGPLRGVIVMRGHVEADVSLGLTFRVELFAGHGTARLRLVLHNPRAAQHPGGFWELGDAGSVLLQRVALEVAPTGHAAGSIDVSIDAGEPFEELALPFQIHQESSGRPNWQSRAHVNRDGRVPLRYQGFRLEAAGTTREGLHARPMLRVGDGAQTVSVTSRLFWEVFPKAYIVDTEGVLSVELLPAIDDLHELQGGEQFTHELALGFGDVAASVLEAFRSPSTVVVDPAWWAACAAVPHLIPRTDSDAPYERLVRAAIDGDDRFELKRDRIDEYGWRNFGDLYADHENGTAADRPPIVSHYNNQYDAISGFIVQLMRSGDARWWALARDLARHVAHIDIYWTDDDKSAYNGGLFWHSYHYVAAGRATHRCYANVEGVSGGGPSVEQNYSTGLMLHHLLTGDPDSRAAVLRMAHWSADMDDGSRTPFRFLSRAPTGLASATGAVDYHGPGRGPAHAIHAFLNAYRLTGEREWIDRAEVLIARCIHPADDLDARNLLDAERRWYYTVFLQALGRYLAVKSELGDQDARWHYARASLLHYARWMADHEYPYLEKPEILEYPTETWAAQDMRKCEVLDLAAVYTPDTVERARFVERSRFFFEASVSTLERWPTRTWTRPVVLMLSYGYAHAWHEAHRDLPLLPEGPTSFGQPTRFEPQRSIAIRRAKGTIAIATVVLVLGLLAWFV